MLLMPDRRDALCAAAELILGIERAAKATGANDTVATVGTVRVHPGAVNSVPSRVDLELDIRDTDPSRRDSVMTQIRFVCESLRVQRGVAIAETQVNADLPATSSPRIVSVIEAACEELGLSHRRMVSRAYHDSLFMAQLAPVAMIFVPCRGGVSHRPDEFATVDAMTRGVAVLAQTLRSLAG